LTAVTANGSIPLLDWGCAVSGAEVASGTDDAQITAYARSLESFGQPVLLRWCWEMNLVRAHQEIGGSTAFVSAWRHIWTIFHQVGATNVSFVWCPALSGVDPAPYYPGDGYVGWIGVDGYDRTGTSTFGSLFTPFYTQWAGHSLPMMVAETGARPPNQVGFLQSIATDAPSLPELKAVVYFDAPGPEGTWSLHGPGLAAFAALARNPYFQPH
jgi:beta-mannanase